MEEDNLYPRDGSFMTQEPVQQRKDREKEEKDVLDSLPLIKRVVDSLEESIAFYQTVDSISDDLMTKPDEFMHAVAANKLTVKNLQAEMLKLQSVVEEFVPDDER